MTLTPALWCWKRCTPLISAEVRSCDQCVGVHCACDPRKFRFPGNLYLIPQHTLHDFLSHCFIANHTEYAVHILLVCKRQTIGGAVQAAPPTIVSTVCLCLFRWQLHFFTSLTLGGLRLGGGLCMFSRREEKDGFPTVG